MGFARRVTVIPLAVMRPQQHMHLGQIVARPSVMMAYIQGTASCIRPFAYRHLPIPIISPPTQPPLLYQSSGLYTTYALSTTQLTYLVVDNCRSPPLPSLELLLL